MIISSEGRQCGGRMVCRVWLVCAALIIAAVNGRAAITATMPYTNKVATFTDLSGNVYPNADLVRAEFSPDGAGRIVFRTNGEFGTVSLLNLSAQTLSSLGVPANHTQIARDLEEQRKAAILKEAQANAEEQQKLLDRSNLIPVKIDSVVAKIGYDPIYGTLYSCRVHLGQNPGVLNILVAKLPDEIQNYYQQVKKTEDEVSTLQSQVNGAQNWAAGASWQLSQQRYQIEQAQAQTQANYAAMGIWVSPSAPNYYIDQAKVQQKYEASMLTNVQDQINLYQEQLSVMQTNLTVLRSQEAAATTLLMLPGRRAFNGFKVFICSPEPVQTATPAEAKKP